MRYLLAIVLPPLAVLSCGKLFSAILNCGLTLLFWLPGVIHAMLVVSSHHADVRAKRTSRQMTAAVDRQTAVLEATSTAAAAREARKRQ